MALQPKTPVVECRPFRISAHNQKNVTIKVEGEVFWHKNNFLF